MRSAIILSITSVLISSSALYVTLMRPGLDPLGSDLSRYDLSNPESSLKSINRMIAQEDLRAGWEVLRNLSLREGSFQERLLFAEGLDLEILKSVEVSGSSHPRNDGLVVSFVRFKSFDAVEHHGVINFRRDSSNRLYPIGEFTIPDEIEPNDRDKALLSAIEEFERTGRVS